MIMCWMKRRLKLESLLCKSFGLSLSQVASLKKRSCRKKIVSYYFCINISLTPFPAHSLFTLKNGLTPSLSLSLTYTLSLSLSVLLSLSLYLSLTHTHTHKSDWYLNHFLSHLSAHTHSIFSLSHTHQHSLALILFQKNETKAGHFSCLMNSVTLFRERRSKIASVNQKLRRPNLFGLRRFFTLNAKMLDYLWR